MKRFGYYFIHWYLRLTELWSMGLLLSVVVLDKEFLLRDMVYVIPLVITVSAVSALFLLAVAVFLKRNGRMHTQFHNGLFQVIEFLTIYVFLIVIFAPTHFGVLNGTEWARAFSRIEYVQDILRLLVSLVASFWVCRYAKKHNFPIMRYVLIAACGICIVSICSNGYRAHIAGSVKEHIDDWHVLGTSKNIIVLIADGMQGSFVESVMNENAELRTAYTDFTLYS